ncbi:hypothetical protein V5799_018097 [Amblyomma americanum]|uniref:Uncharacterized protein n=1 Tax=Amblyomma americanum TaxID=6943 RepID=A0AAQ4F083_AMBAM
MLARQSHKTTALYERMSSSAWTLTGPTERCRALPSTSQGCPEGCQVFHDLDGHACFHGNWGGEERLSWSHGRDRWQYLQKLLPAIPPCAGMFFPSVCMVADSTAGPNLGEGN